MVRSFGASRRLHQYIDALEQVAQGRKVLSPVAWRQKLTTCLDGEPAQMLRRESKSSWLRQQGAYFTSTKMATKLANALAVDADSRRVYFDPTCGAGDLLLAVAKKLPVADTLQRTLAEWGRRLAGCDISPEFIRLAKARLVLLAAKRCRICPGDEGIVLSCTFPKIVEANFLSDIRCTDRVDVVIMNPPFGYIRASDDCKWAQGRVSAAAMFAERAIQDSRKGTRIAAILPDVLRSGSRYKRWRSTIYSLGSIYGERPLGLFDRWTDVDVYLLDFVKAGEKHENSETVIQQSAKRIGGVQKRFTVHVGPVVPHRHKAVGPEVRYIHARSLPAWGECQRISQIRKFNGRLFVPPFVAVRRTSSPNDRKRAVATLVLGKGAVAVENHLIVMLPKDGSTRTCRDLIVRLRSSKTDNWINRRLRCRHLTTGVLADMPWWYKP